MPISRRTVIASLPFIGAASASPAIAHASEPSPLHALIEDHRGAWEKLETLTTKTENAREAFRKAEPIYIGPFKQGWSMYIGEEQVKYEVSQAIHNQRERSAALSAIDPALGDEIMVTLNRTEVEQMAAIRAAFDEQERIYGLDALEEAWDDAEEAQATALEAICEYVCQTVEEFRLKGAYLMERPIGESIEVRNRSALARSFGVTKES